jgi:NAD(P)-dependent dehydrogenase (short-subunit alcohol dehydrogenase family)
MERQYRWNTHSYSHFCTHSAGISDPRLIFITSGTSTLAESGDTSYRFNQSPAKGWPKKEPGLGAYRSSKAGVNMMMRNGPGF